MYCKSSGHVTDDVTWPQKVSHDMFVVIISITAVLNMALLCFSPITAVGFGHRYSF